jgi:hypothetical protein
MKEIFHNIWWKTAKQRKKFGGKRQNNKKNLVENGKTFIFALKLLRYEQRKHTF